MIRDDAKLVDEATEIALGLNKSCLCLQGPPGAGKTYTAANIITQLLKAGHRVGIISNSHAPINHLLLETTKKAAAQKVKVVGWKIRGEKETDFLEASGLQAASSGKEFFNSGEEYNLVGGTAWAFSLEEAIDAFDYLVVDEAGQFSLASLIATARCAKNLILLGDQMQLEQPTKGTHPGESGLSCLQYFMQEHATIPPGLGIFLAQTYRLHPDVCSFISGAVYEGRLGSNAVTQNRRIELHAKKSKLVTRSTGLQFVPVAHEGNSTSSDEEVEMVAQLVKELGHHTYIDEKGKSHKITGEHILVVTPYNAQRVKLEKALGEGIRVGTVDKFQGQEAPIVIMSFCTSDVEASPRGYRVLV